MLKLTGKQKNYLRGLGHHLKPLIQIGKDGLAADFIENLDAELERHELIKVKVLENAPEDKKSLAASIEKTTGSAIVQIIGKIVLVYRPSKEEPKIDLT
ncbi:MAG: ribosome assembly RNA-binding protein YhbY [Proteobacteria bacterium]|nr:ribosome assembly RNA-binding protein YhbY [Pseudomonadota bacterium]